MTGADATRAGGEGLADGRGLVGVQLGPRGEELRPLRGEDHDFAVVRRGVRVPFIAWVGPSGVMGQWVLPPMPSI